MRRILIENRNFHCNRQSTAIYMDIWQSNECHISCDRNWLHVPFSISAFVRYVNYSMFYLTFWFPLLFFLRRLLHRHQSIRVHIWIDGIEQHLISCMNWNPIKITHTHTHTHWTKKNLAESVKSCGSLNFYLSTMVCPMSALTELTITSI